MSITTRALAVMMLSSAFLLTVQATNAQTGATPPATATRPSAPEQTSQPNNAPPASATQTTGESNQDPKVKEMNAREKSKVEREGK